MNIKHFIWIGLLCIALIAGIAYAVDTDTPANLVKTKLTQVTNIFNNNGLSLEKKQAKILDVVVPTFDLPLMAKLTLGKKHWKTIPKAKQQEFSSLYTTLLKRSYLGKVTLYSNEKINFKPPKTEKNKVYVPTELISKGKMVPVTYKLYKSKNGWKIYDAVISGTSIVLSHRIEYDALLRKGSIDDLLDKLRQSLK